MYTVRVHRYTTTKCSYGLCNFKHGFILINLSLIFHLIGKQPCLFCIRDSIYQTTDSVWGGSDNNCRPQAFQSLRTVVFSWLPLLRKIRLEVQIVKGVSSELLCINGLCRGAL